MGARRLELLCPFAALPFALGCTMANPQFDGIEAVDSFADSFEDGDESMGESSDSGAGESSESGTDDAGTTTTESGSSEDTGTNTGTSSEDTSDAEDSSETSALEPFACPEDPSLRACYTFDDNLAKYDGSGNENHLAASSFAMIAGLSGDALHCNESKAVHALDSPSLDITGPLSISAWVRTEAYPNTGRAVWLDNSGQYGLLLDSSAGYVCRVLTSQGAYQVDAPFETVPLDAWTHLACVYDGSSVSLYAGGDLLDSLAAGGTPQVGNAEPVTVGSNSPAFDEPCTGAIDSLSVYARALTPGEIDAMADAG
ncbi:hypothetical protein PPSIR1_28483 [Plesiocystis pacifica SIR-1]|uniref:LamG-like jellyroll fold domain-containing protein n=1 Tax=Plesiocystis pacifica SIR-1 TaxID=391625 RepID=A6FZW9_9BACT|nr:LamG domain-containing protein [Plesiocystis pacifica]EDM80925.1 hypothetical protein PPSIR1_28483 [Plesiocystis pacifica SIR-1]